MAYAKICHPAYMKTPSGTPYSSCGLKKLRGACPGVLEPMHGPPTVAILGGNPVVGRALEYLLESSDYGTRFFSEYLDESAELPGGVRVALVMPALSPDRNDALVTRLRGASGTMFLPIIELVTSPNGHHGAHRIQVSWPCSVEELRRNIEAALVEGSQISV